MKRSLHPVLLVFLSIFAFNCQKEISFDGNLNPGGNTIAPITATIQGKVVDENDQPANGVIIKVGAKTATTDSRGFFRITNASLDKNASLVTAEKTGYFKAYRAFQATSGANHISLKLIKRTMTGTVSSSTGGDIILSNGAKISLPVNAVVKAAGGSYSGTINVYAAYIDPTSIDIGQKVPGSFMADNKDGKRVTLSSYGMLAVELESTAGEKLQIVSGKTATLTSPIPSSILASAPASIALWYLDEQTGIWKEEGTAVKNGNNYVGDVKHFSFWNCDAGFPTVNLLMTLKNSDGIPLVNACVRLKRQTGTWLTSYGYTDSLGKVSGLVPSNETLQLDVLDICNNSVFTQNIGPFTQNTDLGVITVTAPLSAMVTIQGTVLNCNGAPVTNGYAIIDYEFPRYVSTNNAGQFSVSVFRCGGSPPTCSITAVDNMAQQQATVTGIVIVSPVTNTGNIIACGTSTTEFINYMFDGTNYSMSNTVPGDSIGGSTWLQGGPFTTYLFGGTQVPNKDVGLTFLSPSLIPGTYPLVSLYVQNFIANQVLPASDVTLTAFPQVTGGFYEGNFSASFKDSANMTFTHTLSGTFRIRRY